VHGFTEEPLASLPKGVGLVMHISTDSMTGVDFHNDVFRRFFGDLQRTEIDNYASERFGFDFDGID
jgi:hypothetical protein